MPTGAFVMKWDEREGSTIIASFPPDITIGEKTMMQVYSQHQFEGKMGTTAINANAVNLVSYFTGPETQIYLILTLKEGEPSDVYEDALREAGPQLLKYEFDEQIKFNLPLIFQQVVLAPNLTEEQKIASILSDPMQNDLIQRLGEEIAISKSEIDVWLQDKFKVRDYDLETLILRLMKLGLIKIASIKGIGSQILFSVKDLIAIRTPHGEMLRQPLKFGLPFGLRFDYTKKVKQFFETYKILEDTSIISVCRVLLDPMAYSIIKLLRQKVLTKADLEPFEDDEFEDLKAVLSMLEQNNIMATFKEPTGDTEYHALISDVYFEIKYPEYNIDIIAESYRNKVLDKRIILKALDLMREQFYIESKKVKKDTTQNTIEEPKEQAEITEQ